MNKSMKMEITLKEIEKMEGSDELVVDVSAPLSIWYNSIRKRALSQLMDADIIRLVRQRVFLRYTVYEALERLKKDITLGELYDGELLEKLYELDNEFWGLNIVLTKRIVTILNRANRVKIASHDWLTENDKNEFYDLLSKSGAKFKQLAKT